MTVASRVKRIQQLRRQIAACESRKQVRKDLTRELAGLVAQQIRYEIRTERRAA